MLRQFMTTALVTFSVGGCTLHRDISVYGGGYGEAIRGELSGSMVSGVGELYVIMPEGETLSGRATFYTDSGNRKCRGTMVGASGAKLDCTADVDRNTGHGVGTCVDERERKFTWHF